MNQGGSVMSRLSLVTLGSAAIVMLVGSALLVGWAGWAVLAAMAAAVIGTALINLTGNAGRGWILLMVLVGILLLPLVYKLTGISTFGVWQVALMGISLLGVPAFIADLRRHSILRASVAFFLLALAFGLVSSVIGRTKLYAGTYQFLSDLKPWLLVILGYAVIWNDRTERQLWLWVHWLWIPMLLFVLAEWQFPSIYYQAFIGNSHASVDPLGFFPSRAVSIFGHPSVLATTSALITIIIAARIGTVSKGRVPLAFLLVLYFAHIIFAVQRQELVACLIALGFVALLSRPEALLRRLIGVALFSLLGAAVFWQVFQQNLIKEIGSWGFGTIGPVEQPRAQIFRGAFSIGWDRLPFGSGFGTFGGAGAEKFDQSLYEKMGFRNYWWFGREDFLMDTYWPNSIAEFGYIGATCLLLSYLLLMLFCSIRAINADDLRVRQYWSIATSMLAYTLMLSVSSPAFQDPQLFVIPAIMVGIASQLNRRLHGNA